MPILLTRKPSFPSGVLLLGALLAGLAACGTTSPTVMEFVEIVPAQPRIGDVVTVRFRLIDSRGLPLAGSTVEFSQKDGKREGVTLSPTSVASLKGSGYAETQLVATGRVNSVIIVATAGDKSITSPPITFAGTVPSAKQFTFQCGPIAGNGSGGRHAIGAWDESRHLIAGVKLDCTAHTGDRNGDGVTGALVSFMVEAGAVGPSETSVTDVVGNATVLYKTSLPIPLELTPGKFSWTPSITDPLNVTGAYLAPLWMRPYEWIENPLQYLTSPTPITPTLVEPKRPDPIRLKADNQGRYENNPRDNLVTMIAITTGEEGYTDLDNNGKYDQGEPYDDLAEPFVDSNDNGYWDPNERYIDTNNNKTWDPGNGKWDGSTLIWTQDRILWTGMPAGEDSALTAVNTRPVTLAIRGVIKLRCDPSLAVGAPCYQAHDANSTSTPPAANVHVDAFLADPWFNTLARNNDGDGCELAVAGKSPVELKSSTKFGIAFTYPAGEVLGFDVGDARDPNVPPIQQVPKRGFPISFSIPIVCTYTASPKEGHVVKVSVGNVVGDID